MFSQHISWLLLKLNNNCKTFFQSIKEKASDVICISLSSLLLEWGALIKLTFEFPMTNSIAGSSNCCEWLVNFSLSNSRKFMCQDCVQLFSLFKEISDGFQILINLNNATQQQEEEQISRIDHHRWCYYCHIACKGLLFVLFYLMSFWFLFRRLNLWSQELNQVGKIMALTWNMEHQIQEQEIVHLRPLSIMLMIDLALLKNFGWQ